MHSFSNYYEFINYEVLNGKKHIKRNKNKCRLLLISRTSLRVYRYQIIQ